MRNDADFPSIDGTSVEMTLPLGDLPTIDAVVEQARSAERLGYSRVSLPETLGWDGVSLLATVAAKTERLGIANNVFSVYARSPALLGQTAVTLQAASNRDFRLGLGTSSPALVEDWHGLSYERPLRRLRETVEIVKAVTTGDPVEYDGEIFSVSDMQLRAPTPGTRPPIDVAALGPKATELAGRFADGWLPQLFTPGGLRERYDDLRRGAELAGRDPEELRVTLNLRCCALEDGTRARTIARRQLAFLIAMYGPYYRESIAQQGYRDVTTTVEASWKDGNKQEAFDALPAELLETLVVAGTPERVRAELSEFAAIDCLDAIRITFLSDPSTGLEEIRETTTAVAPTETD